MARTAALALASCTLLIGLLAPLTPSEGWPGLVDMILFVGIPVSLALGVATSTRSPGWRLVSAAIILAIVGVITWLFFVVL